MARKNHNHRLDLPPLELECMNALWALGQATVQEIRDRLFPNRPLAYTTVMTVMDRLARKGVVAREKRSRAHLYRASIPEELVRDRAIIRLVENFFQGSREGLRRYLGSAGGKSITRVPQTTRQGHRLENHGAAGPRSTAAPEKRFDTTLL